MLLTILASSTQSHNYKQIRMAYRVFNITGGGGGEIGRLFPLNILIAQVSLIERYVILQIVVWQ
jgi:hypothetical protein